jgi:hypothetical protein
MPAMIVRLKQIFPCPRHGEARRGTETVVKLTGKTTADGAKDVAHATDLVGKEGGHAIIPCTKEGTDKVAHSIHSVGDKTMHASEDTVEDYGKSAKRITIKTADGLL